jgi:hypothetical protein
VTPYSLVAQAVIRRLSTVAARVQPRLRHLSFVAAKRKWEIYFLKYFRFPSQFLFHQVLHIRYLSDDPTQYSFNMQQN